jgi:hypothetical protein
MTEQDADQLRAYAQTLRALGLLAAVQGQALVGLEGALARQMGADLQRVADRADRDRTRAARGVPGAPRLFLADEP